MANESVPDDVYEEAQAMIRDLTARLAAAEEERDRWRERAEND